LNVRPSGKTCSNTRLVPGARLSTRQASGTSSRPRARSSASTPMASVVKRVMTGGTGVLLGGGV